MKKSDMNLQCNSKHGFNIGQRIKLIRKEKGLSQKDFAEGSIGEKIVSSNRQIVQGFKSQAISCSARTLSRFLYSSEVKGIWKHEEKKPPIEETGGDTQIKEISESDTSLFYLEKHLEDF